MDFNDTTALANAHNAEVYYRIRLRSIAVYRVMLDFRYWVYKLDDMSGTPLAESLTIVSRPGWTIKECLYLIANVPYPETVSEMQAIIKVAKAQERTLTDERRRLIGDH